MMKKFFNNPYIFSTFSKIVSVFIGLVYSILYSRYLGAELRGDATIINNYAEILSIVMCLGIFQAYPYYKNKLKQDNLFSDIANNVFALMFIYYVLVITIIFILPIDSNKMIALLISPIMMCSRQFNYIVLIDKPKLSNIANMSLDIFDIVLIIILLIFSKSNYTLCVTIVIARQLFYLFFSIVNLFLNDFHFKPSLKGISKYIKYGIIPIITIILMEINYRVDVLMMEWFDVSKIHIGIYSLGIALAQKIWMIPDALKDILLSSLVNGKGEEEVSKISRISFSITLLVELLLVIFGRYLIVMLYGSEYSDSYLVTNIICMGVVGMVFYKMIYSYNVAKGYTTINLILLAISAIVNVLFNALLIPNYGYLGAAISSLISYLSCGLSFLLFFCKKTGTRFLDMFIIKKDDLRVMFKNL